MTDAKVIPISAARKRRLPAENEVPREIGGVVVVAVVQRSVEGWTFLWTGVETGDGRAVRGAFDHVAELGELPGVYVAELRLEAAAFVLGATLIPALDIF